MIGKIIAIIMSAAVCSAQIAADCGEVEAFIAPECESAPVAYAPVASDYEPEIVRQRVDSRTYPVLLSNSGPSETSMPPVIRAPPVVTPVREHPVIRLPHAPIPGPRVVSHKCTCTKTVIKPQIIQRVITVPRVQRYLRRGYRPVIENVAYMAQPKCDIYDEAPIAVRRALPVELPRFSKISSIC